MDLLERSAPSKEGKEFAYEAKAGNVEVPASTAREKESEREKR
jgi:hypothetical protein